MESIEARAFKSSSFVSEAALKPVNAQALGVREDFFFVSAAGAGTGEGFSVDEFFDLQGLSEEVEEEEEKSSSSSSSSSSSLSLSSHDQLDEGTSFSGADFSGGFSAADGLAIPADDIKELELWSNLMDGALHDDIFACPIRNPYVMPGPNRVRFEPKVKSAMVEATRFPPPALTRPRSKRSRPISGAWSSSSLLKPESSLSSMSSSPEPGRLRVTGTGPTKNRKTVVKRLKRNPAGPTEDGDSADGPAQLMKCTHCQVEKTPQWRTGPLGPKTLCNACGVRFKSGRLFPEYRPACSPTFSSEIHSNSHRKVVEMRKRKIAEPGLAPSILSC